MIDAFSLRCFVSCYEDRTSLQLLKLWGMNDRLRRWFNRSTWVISRRLDLPILWTQRERLLVIRNSPKLKFFSLTRRPTTYTWLRFQNAQSEFHAALCDSFNTPEAMKQILTLVAETNKYTAAEISSIRAEPDCQSLVIISKIAAWISKMLRVFGLGEQVPVGDCDTDLIGWNAYDPVS